MRKHLFPIFIITTLTYLIWHPILNQTFLGEAYYYYELDGFTNNDGKIINPWDLDNFAKFLFQILIPVFKDNLQYYMVTQLIVMTALFVTFYFVLYKITQYRRIALFATIFFLSNYIGSFEMWATGNYQRFAQRIPNLIPELIAFYFLINFYTSKKINFYILSVLLFGLSVYMGHYSSYLLPIFIIYPLTLIKINRVSFREFLKTFFLLSTFLFINLYLIHNSPQRPTVSLASFLTNQPILLVEKVFYQFPLITIPKIIIEFLGYPQNFLPTYISNVIFESWEITLTPFPYTQIVRLLIIPTLLFYIYGAILIKKKLSKLYPLYLTILFSLPVQMLFNVYLYNLNPFNSFGQERYHFLPSMLISILWAMILFVLFSKNIMFKFITLILLASFVIYNTNLIKSDIYKDQYKSEAHKRFYSYIKTISPQFSKDTIIVAPSSLLISYSLINRYYGYKTMQYIDFGLGWEEKVKNFDKERIFILDYDYQPNKGIYYSNKGILIDLTAKFRAGEKINYLTF